MERLTGRNSDGKAFLWEYDLLRVDARTQAAIDRLAAYEDTGLEPEEIRAFLPMLREWQENMGALRHVHELVKAEKDGRLAVLPCIKKYKTMYWLWGDMIMPVRYWGIHGGTVTKDGKYHITCEMRTKKARTFDKNRKYPYAVKAGDRRFFYADDIGKTVFLTREAAEAALAERGSEE